MARRQTVRLAIVLMTALVLTVALPAGAVPIIVDVAGGGDYTTIQEGLTAATEGDTVLVEPGTYGDDGNRDLTFGTNNLKLISRSGAAATIIDNRGDGGHRLFNFISTSQDTTCVIDGFTITGGRFTQAGSPGAGIRIESGPSPKFINCVITGNNSYGSNGGGVYINNFCNPVFENCTFDSNTALVSGGGVYVAGSSEPILRGCTFVSNQCSTGFGGAIAFNYSGMAVVRHASMGGNASGDQGGAIGCFRSNPSIIYTVIAYNLATTTGGAVYAQDADPDFYGCTIVRNRALQGGSVYHATAAAYPTFSDCIMAYSQAAESRGSTYLCDSDGDAIVTFCCSYGNPDGDTPCGTVTFSIEEDPLFCNVWEDDLTLALNSPCLPAGNDWGRHMGALDSGCTLSPVTEASWGTIKAMYR
jgi:parallel beta-helix repeat protein/predicted outer membrane repeat protein